MQSSILTHAIAWTHYFGAMLLFSLRWKIDDHGRILKKLEGSSLTPDWYERKVALSQHESGMRWTRAGNGQEPYHGRKEGRKVQCMLCDQEGHNRRTCPKRDTNEWWSRGLGTLSLNCSILLNATWSFSFKICSTFFSHVIGIGGTVLLLWLSCRITMLELLT